MALSFPSSPSEGQSFSGYVFTSGIWKPAPVRTALPRNYIVNPAMQISQEHGSAAQDAAMGGYPADQWRVMGPMWSQATVKQHALATPRGSPYRLRFTSVAPWDGGSEYCQAIQDIEGTRIADFNYGSANALSAVLRCGVRAPIAGTYAATLQNAAATRTINFPMVVPVADVDTEFVFPVPPCPDGVWVTTTAKAITLMISFSIMGSSFSQPGVWEANSAFGVPGMGGVTFPVSSVLDVFDVGFYADPYKTGKAPPWIKPDAHQDHMDCMRYWYKCTHGRGAISSAGGAVTRMGYIHPVQMRVGPASTKVGSPTCYDVGVNNPITALGTTYPNIHTSEFDGTVAGTTAYRGAIMIGNATNYVAQNARM